ncbi:competence protein CoiA family protein [Staphylococcus haemolyticus]
MLIAINQQGEQVYAHRAKKQDSYFCPHCSSQLLYKCGTKKSRISRIRLIAYVIVQNKNPNNITL